MEWSEIFIFSLPFWIALYFISSTFKFYVKIIFFYSILCFAPLTCLPLAIFRPFDAFNVIYPSYVGQFISWCYGINWVINGKENLAKVKGQSVIVVSNHQAIVDALGLCCVYPIVHPATMVMKKELAYMGLFGLYSILSGCVFLDRKRSEKAKIALNKKMDEVVRRHWSLVVYPEGTRNPDLGRPLPEGGVVEMLPFKKGAFHIAVTSGIPILPIVYEPYLHVYDAKKKIFNSGRLNVFILPPVYTDGLTTDEVSALSERVRCDMMKTVKLAGIAANGGDTAEGKGPIVQARHILDARNHNRSSLPPTDAVGDDSDHNQNQLNSRDL